MKAVLSALLPSRKPSDSPAWIVLMPESDAASAKDCELSSIFQPLTSMSKAVVLFTSNQSAPTGLLLDHGATSEMNSWPSWPGEPISLVSCAAAAAPWTPAAAGV